jgi:hypothetical protein
MSEATSTSLHASATSSVAVDGSAAESVVAAAIPAGGAGEAASVVLAGHRDAHAVTDAHPAAATMITSDADRNILIRRTLPLQVAEDRI